jgi:ferredoxin
MTTGGIRVEVDRELCTGHGRCYSVAPGVFEADSDGFSAHTGEVLAVPEDQVATARLGIRSCPEGAIAEVGDQRELQGNEWTST